MNKKVITTFVLGLFVISFVSAYYYGGGGIGGFLDSMGGDNLFLGGIFILFFATLFWGLNRSMKNVSIAGIISLIISLFITYGIHRSNFDLANIFYKIGIPEGASLIIILIIIAGVGIFLWAKFGPQALFVSLGAILLFLGFAELVYERTTTLIIGLLFLAVGAYWWIKYPPEKK